MTKLLLILFIFSAHLFSSEQIKLKAKQKHDIVRVKTSIPYKSVTYLQAYKRTGDKSNAHFITQVSAEVNNQTVFQMSTGSSFPGNSMLKFSFSAKWAGETLKIIVRDNNGQIMQKSQKIKNIKKNIISKKLFIPTVNKKEINYRLTKPKVWGETTIDNAITALYGKVNFIDRGIKLKAPKCVYDGVPINIKSNLELTSIAVFQSSSSYPTTAIITVFEKQPIDYYLWINVRSDGSDDIQKIIVIGQDKEGKLYRAQHQVNAITYTHHHCNENGEVVYDL